MNNLLTAKTLHLACRLALKSPLHYSKFRICPTERELELGRDGGGAGGELGCEGELGREGETGRVGELGRDGEGCCRRSQGGRVDGEDVGAREAVDVDVAGAAVLAARYLRRAEVAAPGP